MDAGTPKEVPYRWFLRLTEPATPPPHNKAKEDEAREQKVAPQQAAHSKGQACQKEVFSSNWGWKFSAAPTFAPCGKWEPLRLILLTLSPA